MGVTLTEKICEVLVRKSLVSEEDLSKARKICSEKGGNLGNVLVGMHMITKEDLLTALSEELGLPPIKLTNLKIADEVIGLIPHKVAVRYQVIPVSRDAQRLTVAMVDPLNIFALDDLRILTRLEISPVIASEDDVREAISRYYERSADEEISAIVEDIESTNMEMVSDEDEEFSSGDLLRIVEEAPVVKLTNMVLSRAVKERASDILVEPMEESSRVRYRIDGVLVERYAPPRRFHQALISRLKVMSDLDITERRLPQDGRFKVKVEGRAVDFRVSIVPSSYGEKAALRVLDKGQAMIDLDRLGFRNRDIQKIRAASARPHGMILVCGPTGCGKTTTLYSVLKHVDDPAKNLVTVEDPVEYELKGINQVSINEDIGLTFAGCLRSILRQDPDVIMVGEIRDYDTLDIAIKSALTGHLVLSTLHTNTACGSITRMINMGVEPFLVTSSVELIAAQRLLRRLCPECKEPYRPTEEVAERYGIFDQDGKVPQIYRPVGCKRCMDTGYRGRTGIIECLELSTAVKDMVFKRAQGFEIERLARSEGMTTLRENGMENVIAGFTSLEEVLRATIESRSSDG